MNDLHATLHFYNALTRAWAAMYSDWLFFQRNDLTQNRSQDAGWGWEHFQWFFLSFTVAIFLPPFHFWPFTSPSCQWVSSSLLQSPNSSAHSVGRITLFYVACFKDETQERVCRTLNYNHSVNVTAVPGRFPWFFSSHSNSSYARIASKGFPAWRAG